MSNFWERNKKKSKWALLLLLLRWRKGLVPLLLLVVLILVLFSAPSNLLAALVMKLGTLPGGRRLAAGIAWGASRLGLGGFETNDPHSFGELLAALRAAKSGRDGGFGALLRGGGDGASGDSFAMIRGGNDYLGGKMQCVDAEGRHFTLDAGAIGDGPTSCGGGSDGSNRAFWFPSAADRRAIYLCSSRRQIECEDMNVAQVKGGDSVNGVMNPEEAKAAGNGVSLDRRDLRGERQGLVESAYADEAGRGRGSRLSSEFTGGGDGGSISKSFFSAGNPAGLSDGAGAYANKSFFSASGHAQNPDNVRSTLSGNAGPGSTSVPKATGVGTATRRPMDWHSPRTLQGESRSSVRNYGSSGGQALGQLVQARNAGLMSSGNICNATNGCPPEYASMNVGATYDGTEVGLNGMTGPRSTPSFLSGPTQIDGVATPNVPDPNIDLGNIGDVTGNPPDPALMNRCMGIINECQRQKDMAANDMQNIANSVLNPAVQRLAGECGDCCNCDQCNADKALVDSTCAGPIKADYKIVDDPCVLPPECNTYSGKDANCQSSNGTACGVVYDKNIQDSAIQKPGFCNGAGYNGSSCATANFLGFCVCL